MLLFQRHERFSDAFTVFLCGQVVTQVSHNSAPVPGDIGITTRIKLDSIKCDLQGKYCFNVLVNRINIYD